ncbi:hypothetical protein [Novosphingobium sp. 9]|uniref:hypothetical protein n=1 Tax=Novosphingobium sp. 9 TaxID=2025349 RepID=UPI0021B66FE2|nr:hypothetical protein [Novosphingobium sp. 9]
MPSNTRCLPLGASRLILPNLIALGLGLTVTGGALQAQTVGAPESAIAASGPTFADVAGLADSAGMVVHAQVRKIARVDDARAPGLAPGYGRFYVQAQTVALLVGSAPLGAQVAYLVDLPLNERGKPDNIKKRDVLLFARAVPGRPGELQLVTPTAQQMWSPEADARVRQILTTLVSPNAPVKIEGVREIMYVPGNLAGQGETQMFLKTANNSAASITVHHEPGVPASWGCRSRN